METIDRSARRLPPSEPALESFQDIDISRELAVRPPRVVNLERERDGLVVLAAELTANPRNMLHKLVEVAVDLCAADSAGISLLDGTVFRWEAVAGQVESARGRTLPRDQSPCGLCIDRNRTHLMHLPDRHFPALASEPRFVELLLIPFHSRGTSVGTVWIVSHSADRRFDREDERTMRVLADFAAAGWQLSTAYDAAADANHRKDEFLAMLGHELRNPLAAITTATSLIKPEVGGNARATRAIDVVARQCRHLSRLADDLLDAGRVASGKLQIDARTLNLTQVLGEAIETCRTRAEERSLNLFAELPSADIWIEGDAVRLTQAFCNLLDNATKYTSSGGRIFVSCDVGDRTVSVAVGDTGRGIRRDQLHVIFEPFAQLSDPQGARGGGLGLGLSLVRRVVELHRGTVMVQSDGLGKGSRFTVILPLRNLS